MHLYNVQKAEFTEGNLNYFAVIQSGSLQIVEEAVNPEKDAILQQVSKPAALSTSTLDKEIKKRKS